MERLHGGCRPGWRESSQRGQSTDIPIHRHSEQIRQKRSSSTIHPSSGTSHPVEGRRGLGLTRSSQHQSFTLRFTHLQSAVHLFCMFLLGGSQRTQREPHRTWRLTTEQFSSSGGFETRTFLRLAVKQIQLDFFMNVQN